jgi:hypothetical protein
MADIAADAKVLIGGRGYWSATPGNYSSLRFLRFAEDGTGDATYGYGQTIYALIKCQWELPAPGRLRLTYLDSPPYQLFKGFTPDDSNRIKELASVLTEGEVSGVESIVVQPYRFLWTLELSDSPWPAGLALPHTIPRVFYGHRQPTRPAGS